MMEKEKIYTFVISHREARRSSTQFHEGISNTLDIKTRDTAKCILETGD